MTPLNNDERCLCEKKKERKGGRGRRLQQSFVIIDLFKTIYLHKALLPLLLLPIFPHQHDRKKKTVDVGIHLSLLVSWCSSFTVCSNNKWCRGRQKSGRRKKKKNVHYYLPRVPQPIIGYIVLETRVTFLWRAAGASDRDCWIHILSSCLPASVCLSVCLCNTRWLAPGSVLALRQKNERRVDDEPKRKVDIFLSLSLSLFAGCYTAAATGYWISSKNRAKDIHYIYLASPFS